MKKRIIKRGLALLLLFSFSLLFAGCNTSKNVKLTLTIDGHEFDFNSTVQDLYDAGFVLCDTGYGNAIPTSELPELEARTVDTISEYYVARPNSTSRADITGVSIQVYNPSSKTCSFMDNSIFCYTYRYDPTSPSIIPVQFNGVSFAGLSYEEGATAMESLGITFEEGDKKEFLDPSTNEGYGWSMLTGSSNYMYFISREPDIDGSLYVDEMYFKKKLDIEY